VKKKIAKELRRRKQRIQYRLRDINWKEQGKPAGAWAGKPMFAAGNIHYDDDCWASENLGNEYDMVR
jgi:hypothetical protein